MRSKIISLALICGFSSLYLRAQEHVRPWTIEDCIDYAIHNSIDIKKLRISKSKNEENSKERRWAFIPTLSLNTNNTISSGRVLDPTTYQFETTSITGNSSTTFSSEITLYDGGLRAYELKKTKLALDSDEQSIRDEILQLKIRVISSFLEMALAKKQIAIAKETVKLLEEQLAQSQNLFEAGKSTESDVLQITSQLYVANNDVFSAESSYNMARLALCDILEINEYDEFEIFLDTNHIESLTSIDVEAAISNHPEFQKAILEKDYSDINLKIARTGYLPKITLTMGYGSNYSESRKKIITDPSGEQRVEKYSFWNQYRDNASAYVTIGLSIPIFDRFSTKSNIKRAKLDAQESLLIRQQTMKEIRHQILQAEIDRNTALDKYNSSQKQLIYSEEAYRQITNQYKLGKVDYISWNTSLVEMVKAKYENELNLHTLLLKDKILKYMNGE